MITSRCQMSCGHCCFSCTEQGQDMLLSTFKKACELAERYGSSITLGGGEPLLHPRFWEFLGIALARSTDADVIPCVITNGACEDDAVRLAALARRGVISASLSLDEWHDQVSDRVHKAFLAGKPERGSFPHDCRGEHGCKREPIPVGRAAREFAGNSRKDDCVCADVFVMPRGNIWGCACRTVHFGTVNKPAIPADWVWGECYRHQAAARGELQEEVLSG